MRILQNLIASIVFCAALVGCYSPIMSFESIALAKHDEKISNQKICKDTRLPLIFYKECSRNGSAWLYECQNMGLDSIQQALSLYKSNASIRHITFFFYPKKTYMRFEIDDCATLQER